MNPQAPLMTNPMTPQVPYTGNPMNAPLMSGVQVEPVQLVQEVYSPTVAQCLSGPVSGIRNVSQVRIRSEVVPCCSLLCRHKPTWKAIVYDDTNEYFCVEKIYFYNNCWGCSCGCRCICTFCKERFWTISYPDKTNGGEGIQFGKYSVHWTICDCLCCPPFRTKFGDQTVEFTKDGCCSCIRPNGTIYNPDQTKKYNFKSENPCWIFGQCLCNQRYEILNVPGCQIVGTMDITGSFKQCCPVLCGYQPSALINFPLDANFEEKMAIIGTAVTLMFIPPYKLC